MKVSQIQTLSDLWTLWPFVVECINATSLTLKTRINHEELFNVMSTILAHPGFGWIGLAEDGVDQKLSIAIVHNNTPVCSPVKTFYVRFFYHVPNRAEVSLALLHSFEQWARKHGVQKLDVSTVRQSGAAIRCFKSKQFGFRTSVTYFERQIK